MDHPLARALAHAVVSAPIGVAPTNLMLAYARVDAVPKYDPLNFRQQVRAQSTAGSGFGDAVTRLLHNFTTINTTTA